MKQPLIELKDVFKRLGQQIVLRGTNLSVHRGEVASLIGKSGEGKSVLLKHIIGLMRPDSGQVLFKGQSLSTMRRAERKALKKKFSYMFQSNALFDSMTVFENISLPLKEGNSITEAEIQRQVLDKMQQLELQEIEYKYPSQLSGGMQKRVALARALVTDPEIVLFDEPTTGLDPIRKSAVYSMISEYQRRFGFTALIVSHDIPDIFYVSQRVAMLHEGRILFEGTPDEIQATDDPVVLQFIKGLESRHDTLTGIAPLPEGTERFMAEMARLKRHEVAFSLILFTMENMDEINEKAGHLAGQSLLRNFATELKRNLRISDTCSRYGMNRILVVLPHTNLDQARMTCAKLARSIKIEHILRRQAEPGLCFTVSAGFAEAEQSAALEQILGNAESTQNMLYEFRVC